MLLGGLSLVAISALRSDQSETSGVSEDLVGDDTLSQPDTAAPDPSSPPDEATGPAVFGETVTYEDGLSVTVDPPVVFAPSETAAFDEAPAYITLTINVTNDGTETFDPSWFIVFAQSGEHEASAVFDSEQGLEGTPYTVLLPGRTVSWDEGFGVDDPQDVVVQISPSLEHEDSVFVTG